MIISAVYSTSLLLISVLVFLAGLSEEIFHLMVFISMVFVLRFIMGIALFANLVKYINHTNK